MSVPALLHNGTSKDRDRRIDCKKLQFLSATAKPILKSKHGMYVCRQWCFSAYDGRNGSCFAGRKTHQEKRKLLEHPHRESCTCSWWKIILRCCLWGDYAMSWVALFRGNWDTISNKRQEKKPALVAVTRQTLLHHWIQFQPDTTPQGETLRQIKKWRKPCAKCWKFDR